MAFTTLVIAAVFALSLDPTSAAARERDEQYGKASWIAMPGALLLLSGTGLALAHAENEAVSQRRRIGFYAGGMSSALVGAGLFITGMTFVGRRLAYVPSDDGGEKSGWKLGPGAAAGYLSAAIGGAALYTLGSYAIAFNDAPNRVRRNGFGIAGMIVGGMMMTFGGALGGITLGAHLERRCRRSSTAELRFHLPPLTLSGRF